MGPPVGGAVGSTGNDDGDGVAGGGEGENVEVIVGTKVVGLEVGGGKVGLVDGEEVEGVADGLGEGADDGWKVTVGESVGPTVKLGALLGSCVAVLALQTHLMFGSLFSSSQTIQS